MIVARKLAQAQTSARRLSVLSASYEFPHPHVVTKAPVTPRVTTSTLESGVRIVSREKDCGTVSFKVSIGGGSSTESAAQRGAAHLLASAGFAGTSADSGLVLVRFLEDLGARFSVSADKEKICYDVSVMADDRAEQALRTILTIVASPPKELYMLEEAKEHAAVLQKMRAACPTSQLMDAVHEAAYGDGPGYGSNGYAHNLKRLSVEEVSLYRQRHFVRENLTVVANGGFSADAVKNIVEFHVNDIHSHDKETGLPTLPVPTFVGGDVRVRADLNEKTHLALAFPTPAGDAGRAYEVLAGLVNARARHCKLGAFTHGYHHGGLFGLRSSGCVSSATNGLQSVMKELNAIAGGAAPELEAIKTSLSLKHALNLESGGAAATSELLNSNKTDLRTVSASAVIDAAKQVLKTAKPAFAVYGHTTGVPDAKSFF